MSVPVAVPVSKPVDIKKSLIDAVVAGLLALIVFGPIVGIVLDGYSFNLQPTRVAWLVGVFPRASKAPTLACMCSNRIIDRACTGSFRC